MKWLFLMATAVMGVPIPKLQESDGDSCGYNSCPEYDPAMLNVHIVPHTHNDVGWLKTVDQYYYGSNSDIQNAGVQYILDTVTRELWEDMRRKFVYVETAFFWKWWLNQPKSIRERVHILVRQGRLQFAGGAWSMNDEATTHYQSIIDQFTWGLSKLNETFGKCGRPLVSWQIDPFGHSREFASLVANMGYDGLFLGRIDQQDREHRMAKKLMEMIWRGDDDLGRSSDIFTTVLFDGYTSPQGFCYDITCNDEPLVADKNSPAFNVEEKIATFLEYVQKQATFYRTNNILIPFGGDFNFQDAGMVFRNLDKLIEHSNTMAVLKELNITIYYSTPTCYLKAIQDSEPTLPIKQDDFFPYSNDKGYWTGYYTSRPTIKFFERQANRYLQMVKQIQVLANLHKSNEHFIDQLKSAMGVLQHHDAITGTEKDHVAHDYERMLDMAIEGALTIVRQGLNKYLNGNPLKLSKLRFNRCKFNESSCATSENSHQFIVAVYNPLAWNIMTPIRIPVLDSEVEVYAPTGHKIKSQLVEIEKSIRSLPLRNSKATHEVVFMAHLHAVSYKTFYIRRTTVHRHAEKVNQGEPSTRRRRSTTDNEEDSNKLETRDEMIHKHRSRFHRVDKREGDGNVIVENWRNIEVITPESEVSQITLRTLEVVDNLLVARSSFDDEKPPETAQLDEIDEITLKPIKPEEVVLENQHMKLSFNENGEPTNIIFKNGTELPFTIRNFYYPAPVSSSEVQHYTSGAYIFSSYGIKQVNLHIKDTIEGSIVREVRLISSEHIQNTLRLYEGLNYLECEWLVGPIYVDDQRGKEYVITYISDLKNQEEFYTDSNGRQIIKRRKDKRATWEFADTEAITSNYYPVTNKIFLMDEKFRMAVLTDRAQGGTSVVNGEIELMIHRRLLHDDSLGVGEPLDEINDFVGLVVRGRHRILISEAENKNQYVDEKRQVFQFHLEPIVLIADALKVNLDEWLLMPNKAYYWLHDIPNGIHLLTLEAWGENTLLLRLENYLETYDLDNTTIEVDLVAIFSNLTVTKVRETTLGANMWYDEYKKMFWNIEKQFSYSFNEEYGTDNGVRFADNQDVIHDLGPIVHLKARQIRTFVVNYKLS